MGGRAVPALSSPLRILFRTKLRMECSLGRRLRCFAEGLNGDNKDDMEGGGVDEALESYI
jgi:hypothetical protein